MTEQNSDILFDAARRHRPRHLQPAAGAQRIHVPDVRAGRRDLRGGEQRSLRIKVLIFTGAGDKAFAAGTDINQFRAFRTPQDAIDYEARNDRVLGMLESCRVPTIAAIAGACTGGGAGIAACCDLRIGTKTANFGFPIARTLGNCLSMANYGRLAALLGPARVKDIIFTARLVEAQEALALGLLSEVVEDVTALQARADELAKPLAGHAPLTLRATKEALRRLQPRLAAEQGHDLILMCYMSKDFREGLDAFLTKRTPQWCGGVGCALPRQRREDARPGARALVERGEIVLLVRRMHAVVIEAEADQQRVHAEHVLEIADDRDRAAGADRDRLVAPLLGQRRARLGERRIVVGDLQRRAAGVIDEVGLGVGRQLLAHELAE